MDPRVLGPGLAPTPFTPAEIRRGCPSGRLIELLVEQDGAEPYVRFNRFVDCDEDGATIERGTEGGDVRSGRSTWAELQAHAAFPAEATTIEQATLDLPIGTVECLRYTVGETVFWFATAFPGMPVRIRTTENGVTTTTTMIRG